MKIKMHYTVSDIDDEAIFEGESVEEIISEVRNFEKVQGLDAKKNNLMLKRIICGQNKLLIK